MKRLLRVFAVIVFGLVCYRLGYFIGEVNANIKQGAPAYVCFLDIKERLEKNDPRLIGDIENLLKQMNSKNARGTNGEVMTRYFVKRQLQRSED